MDIAVMVSFGGLLMAWLVLPIKKMGPIGTSIEETGAIGTRMKKLVSSEMSA